MRGKIYRFIFIETLFRLRFIIFLVAITVSLLEFGALVLINKKIDEGEQRKSLIVQVEEMERILYPKARREQLIASQPVEPIQISGKKYALKGIRELEGRLSVLINEDVYQEDDMIQDYRIAKITVDSVLFKHIKTGELKILRFGY